MVGSTQRWAARAPSHLLLNSGLPWLFFKAMRVSSASASDPFCLHQPSFQWPSQKKISQNFGPLVSVCSAPRTLPMGTVVGGMGLIFSSLGHDSNLQTHETWAGPLLLASSHTKVALQRLCTLCWVSQQAVHASRESLGSEANAAAV